jgi:hypothetical protein
MKVISTSDWHFTAEVPEKRIDDYTQAMRVKIWNIVQYAKSKYDDEIIILHGGDLTDSPFMGYGTFCKLHNLLHGCTILTVYGQHDLRYRNRGNTPLDALEHSLENFEIVRNDPIIINPIRSSPEIYVYGCSFGEEIPEIKTEGFNILLVHKMILGKEKEDWEIEKGYSDGEEFLKKHKFDLIVSGDNHKAHTASVKSVKGMRYLFNSGSLMRMTTKQIRHRPRFYVLDTDTSTFETVYLPIEASENVFNLEDKVKSDEETEEMRVFMTQLAEHKTIGFNFEEDLVTYEQTNKIPSDLVKIRQECM